MLGIINEHEQGNQLMNSHLQERLYKLLPTIYRQRDAQQGEPLRALMAVMEQELIRMEREIDSAYANCFVETCAPEILPYLADLLGITNLHDAKGILTHQRARIANTIYHRRRKGQAATVEQVIADVTHWRAKIVDYVKVLAMTQHILRPRPQTGMTANIRDRDAMDILNGPFDRTAHMVEISKPRPLLPEYRVGNLGLYIWRLPVYPIIGATAHAVANHPGCYTFNPLGLDTPLFNYPATIEESTESAAEAELPVAIRTIVLQVDLESVAKGGSSAYYGPKRSIYLILNGQPVAASQILVTDLSDNWQRPVSDKIAIDPECGRIALATADLAASITVNYCYAFSSELGGGPYNRQASLATLTKPIIVTKGQAHLWEAITEWLKSTEADGIIQINDNETYLLPGEPIHTLGKRKLVIQANDGCRPCIKLANDVSLGSENLLEITFNGLLVAGSLKLMQNVWLNLIHSTLVPQASYSLTVDSSVSIPGGQSRVVIDHSIVGKIFLPDVLLNLTIRDSIIDGQGNTAIAADAEHKNPGPILHVERSTIFGSSYVAELPLASEIISTGPITVERIEKGCVRYSYLPIESSTPPRYRCQPDLDLVAQFNNTKPLVNLLANRASPAIAQAITSLKPKFTSVTYNNPSYAQLSQDCHLAITTGAEDGSEMGVFLHLQQAQRKEQLNRMLDEYVPYTGGLLIVKYVN